MACPSHLSCWGTGQFRNENLTCPVCSPVIFRRFHELGLSPLFTLRELGLSPFTRMPPFTRMKLTCPPFVFPHSLSPFHLGWVHLGWVRPPSISIPFYRRIWCPVRSWPVPFYRPRNWPVPFRCPFYRLGGRQGLRCHQLVSLMRAIDSI